MIEVSASKHSVFPFVNHWDQNLSTKIIYCWETWELDWKQAGHKGMQCSSQTTTKPSRTSLQSHKQPTLQSLPCGTGWGVLSTAPQAPASAALETGICCFPKGFSMPLWAAPIPKSQSRECIWLVTIFHCGCKGSQKVIWSVWFLWWALLLLKTYVMENSSIIGEELRLLKLSTKIAAASPGALSLALLKDAPRR